MSKTKKILLVDDDEAFVESNKDLLEAYGYEVFTAYDGMSGFEIALREHPDLMILDVMMTHDTEGFEIARKIQGSTELKAMKVILVSGITKTMNLPFKLEPDSTWLPVNRVLEKPIDPPRIIKEIERALKEK